MNTKEKPRTQRTVYPEKSVNINEWFKHIHGEVVRDIVRPKQIKPIIEEMAEATQRRFTNKFHRP